MRHLDCAWILFHKYNNDVYLKPHLKLWSKKLGIDKGCDSCASSYYHYFFIVGAGAVEFIICHAEVSIAFVEEKKIAEVK